MVQKLFINQTNYMVNGIIVVRQGDNPGTDLPTTVNFTVEANSQQMVPYGDANDPYVDQLTLSGLADGGLVLSDQIVMTRGSALDNLFNMNDTVTITLEASSFVITTSNTWTV